MAHIQIVKKYWEAEGKKDMDGAVSCFAADATYLAPGLELTGSEAIKKFYESAWGGFRSLSVTPTNWVESGDEIAVQYDCHFIRSSGEERLVKGFNYFKISKGLIREVSCYFNPADF